MQEIIRIDLETVNCYLVKENDKFILIDTGGHTVMDKAFDSRKDQLEKRMIEEGVTSDNLKLIILTHGDNDHACNALYLREKYNTLIAMHPGDKNLVEAPTIEDYMKSYQYRTFVNRLVFKMLYKMIKRLTQKILDDFQTFSPDILLKDGDDLLDYGFALRMIATPGHTSGSICILTKENDLLCGDLFVNHKKAEIAPNALDFKELKDSFLKLKAYQIKSIYPGHGKPIEKGVEKLWKSF